MKKVAIAGCGLRLLLAFVPALKNRFGDRYVIAGLMDVDPGKMRGFAKKAGLDVPMFTDFDQMCDAVRPDLVLIGSVDRFHAQYVIRALDRKIAVVSEKPLCVDFDQCRDILAARRRNPEVFAVTSHNSRYRPVARTLKKLLSEGIIGKVVSAEYRETLDRIHGKSYFRRWNSLRKFSNGLELHKSCHHFDKLNHLLDSYAVEVSAAGALLNYGAKAPHRYEGVNCHTCPHKAVCPDFFQYDAELFDSDLYTPDRCIWSPEIDIEDNFSAGIRFANGVYANYSLCAAADYEGEVIQLQGELGRLEAVQLSFSTRLDDVHNTHSVPVENIRVYRFGKAEPEEFPIEHIANGAHGGADYTLFSDLFAENPPPSLPTLEDGVLAVTTGAAVVESIMTGKKVAIPEDILRMAGK
ncbi:MAG: Gfo/Idh/MocA family oxidoreductase [Lentisphaeria bacterium]|nr:Gfo/Idh/MocA family oxidoreductase [Lentisphaeria bacterium]